MSFISYSRLLRQYDWNYFSKGKTWPRSKVPVGHLRICSQISVPGPRPWHYRAGFDRGRRLPTWVVNSPTPKFCWMQFCVGSPLVTKFLCGQVNLFWIAHAAAECIAAKLSQSQRCKYSDVYRPNAASTLSSSSPLTTSVYRTCFESQTEQQFQLLPHQHHCYLLAVLDQQLHIHSLRNPAHLPHH